MPVGDIRVAGSFAAGRSVADAPPVGDVTMVFEVPAMRSPSAILRAIGRDGREHDVRIDGTLLTIGRAADNGLAIDDAEVSRHHARLRARHGMLVLTDLDSTNGVRVNGVRGRRSGARGGRPDRDRRHGPRRRGRLGRLMDPTVATIWLIRLLFLGLLYLFLFGVVRVLLRDLRSAAREPVTALGRLIVVGSRGRRAGVGATFALDAVATLGRDVNNTIVVDDPFVEHRARRPVVPGPERGTSRTSAAPTGRSSTARRIDGLAMVAFGDELQLGRVRFRLERAG